MKDHPTRISSPDKFRITRHQRLPPATRGVSLWSTEPLSLRASNLPRPPALRPTDQRVNLW
jgi:hypothetical protein